ncbi:MAG: hypothetical protein ACREU9_01560 [Gammaproteobacteria bacterium]
MTTAQSVKKTLDAQGTWIIGFSFKPAALPGGARDISALLDTAVLHVDLVLNADGTLAVRRAGSVTLGTTTFGVSAGSTYYIEWKIVISDTVGTVDVVVDGSNKLSLTGQDTRNAGNATANVVRLGLTSAAGTIDYDDVYICDGTGSAPNNTFLGDSRVDYVAPTGAGTTTQLTRGGTDSGANWSQVDEAAPNDDTDYNEHATVGNKDTYAFADITHTPTTIFGIQVLAHAKKDDAGAKSIATVTRSTSDFDGATQALSTSYLYYSDIRAVDPNTSAAWTKVNLNAAEHGAKVAA